MKKITAVFIIDRKKKPFQLLIPVFLLKLIAILAFLVLTVLGCFFVDYYEKEKFLVDYKNTLHENKALKNEAQILMLEIKKVKNSLEEVNNYAKKIGQIIQLESLQVTEKTGLRNKDTSTLNQENTSSHSFQNRLLLGVDLNKFKFRPVLQELSNLKLKARKQAFKLRDLLSEFTQKKSKLRSLPLVSPVKGWLTSNFGFRKSPFTGKRTMHRGVDIAAPVGTSIKAPADGVVIFSGKKSGFGNFIMLAHYGYGLVTHYGHNAKNFVQAGTHVKKGDVIAAIGISGRATGPHLHYEVWKDGKAVNPRKFILNSRQGFLNF